VIGSILTNFGARAPSVNSQKSQRGNRGTDRAGAFDTYTRTCKPRARRIWKFDMHLWNHACFCFCYNRTTARAKAQARQPPRPKAPNKPKPKRRTGGAGPICSI
jgi:hypothetical protein